MKIVPFKIPFSESSSFRVQIDEMDHFYDKFHHHDEVQITWIQKSYGSLLMGNSITSFFENDLLVIGANVPHCFRNDKMFYDKKAKGNAKSTCIFFNENAFGEKFFELPELRNIHNFIKGANRGFRIKGSTKAMVLNALEKMENKNGVDRILTLIKILDQLSRSKEMEVLSKISFLANPTSNESKRLENVFQFVVDNYNRTIQLKEAAAITNLSISAFCRFFKQRTQKTFSQFVNEFRISIACKKMIQDEDSISETCYKVGFSNLSNFNRQFKQITGFTPSKYISKYKD